MSILVFRWKDALLKGRKREKIPLIVEEASD